jgi:hypothetical protein
LEEEQENSANETRMKDMARMVLFEDALFMEVIFSNIRQVTVPFDIHTRVCVWSHFKESPFQVFAIHMMSGENGSSFFRRLALEVGVKRDRSGVLLFDI